MSEAYKVWIPYTDGGLIEVPVTDARVAPRAGPPAPPGAARAPIDGREVERRHHAAITRARWHASRPLILGAVAREPLETPAFGEFAYKNNTTAEHEAAVLFAINEALAAAAETRTSVEDQLVIARELITSLRELGPDCNPSVILRDAERYLWGRAGVIVFGRKGTLVDAFIAFNWVNADTTYQTIKFFALLLNAATGRNYGKFTASLPFSPLGGNFWFTAGYNDYVTRDLVVGGVKRPAYRPTAGSVQAFRAGRASADGP